MTPGAKVVLLVRGIVSDITKLYYFSKKNSNLQPDMDETNQIYIELIKKAYQNC